MDLKRIDPSQFYLKEEFELKEAQKEERQKIETIKI